jgi:hypothetical protein
LLCPLSFTEVTICDHPRVEGAFKKKLGKQSIICNLPDETSPANWSRVSLLFMYFGLRRLESSEFRSLEMSHGATAALRTPSSNYVLACGFTNLAPIIAAIIMKNNTATPPHIPATLNEVASPFNPTSSFSKTFASHWHRCKSIQ